MPRSARRQAPPPPPPVSPESASRSAVQPPRAPTGLPQGEHQALVQSQQAVPMENTGGRLQAAIASAQQGNPLGQGDMLDQPSARPDEPVQAGLPMGAGPGPEAVPPPMAPMDPDDPQMARYLPMLETLADQPNASMATRNFVRRLRGSLNPSITMQGIVQGGPPVAPPPGGPVGPA